MSSGKNIEGSCNQRLVPRRKSLLAVVIMWLRSFHACVITFRYELVWQEVTRLYNEMIQHENWPIRSGETISLPAVQHVTTNVALSTILAVGFGLPLSWADGSTA